MSDEWVAVIIEDDPDVGELVQMIFTRSGYRTVLATNGEDGVKAVRENDPILTTLDVNMPGMDGFAVARRLREFSSTYLIMITGMVSEIDMIRGFEAGADDYLIKPFRPRELRARAESMMRRPRVRHDERDQPIGRSAAAAVVVPDEVVDDHDTAWARTAALELDLSDIPASPAPAAHEASVAPTPAVAAPAAPAPPAPVAAPAPPSPSPAPSPSPDGMLRSGSLVAHPASGSVHVDGRAVQLDAVELTLLTALLETGRRGRSKAELVLAMRGEHSVTSRFVNEADKRAVDHQVARLRKKLGDVESAPRFIETLRGVGYRMVNAD